MAFDAKKKNKVAECCQFPENKWIFGIPAKTILKIQIKQSAEEEEGKH